MSRLNRRKFLETTMLGAVASTGGSVPVVSSRFSAGVSEARETLKKGGSGGIYIHPWDITDEGIDDCFDILGNVCGLNELFVAAIYHAGTFLLTHNPKRMVRWDDGSAFFVPQHQRWRETNIRPVIGDCVDTTGYLHNIVDNARKRNWGVLFFVVFHFSHSMVRTYPQCAMVDAMGGRHGAYLCPANPDVRAHDLAVVEELMDTYGGDGIRFESLGYGRWNFIFVVNKVDVQPSPRDQFLLSLCFCGSCCGQARVEGFDVQEFRREVRSHLYRSLPRPPAEWDTGEVNEEWCRNVFCGSLWKYMEVRFNTVTSLIWEIQRVVNRFGGALMPFGLRNERNLMNPIDYTRFYPHMKRVNLGPRGNTREAQKISLAEQVRKVPEWAEAQSYYVQHRYSSREALRSRVRMAEEVGIRHHSFHYYGMTRRHQLEWIGDCRDAWG